MPDDNIKVMKLVTGEMLLGQMSFDKVRTGIVLVKNVVELREVMMPPKEEGQDPEVRLVFQPFMPFTEAMDELELVHDNILCMAEPIPNVLQGYQAQFKQVITPEKTQLIKP